MKFIEELRTLDINDIGRWPFSFRAIVIGLIFVLVAAGGFYQFAWKAKSPQLERARAQEVELRASFEAKQRKAANFEAYKAQLEEIEQSFGTMLRQLPGRTEVPSLLVDISQTGLAASLDEKLFQLSPATRKDFYAELPIRIRLKGGYHEIGQFVSDIAQLPRIVTLHDIEIKPDNDQPEELVLDLTAKTYRYMEDDEEAGT